MIRPTLLLMAASALVACGQPAPPAETKTDSAPAAPSVSQVGQTGEAPIMNRQGQQVGTAHLTEGPNGLLVRLEFRTGALSPGWHGLHFHEKGACDDAAAGFKASGAHAGHAEGGHGLLNPRGPEPGDLPSIFSPAASGAFEAEVYSPFLTLGQGQGRTPVWDADGSALIIHANRDDQTSQPIGGAGDRVACAVFTAG